MNALHTSFVAVTLASSMLFTGQAFAGHHTSYDDPALGSIDGTFQKAAQQVVISGVITQINGTALTVTVGTGHKAKNYNVTADRKTKVTLDKSPVPLSKLQLGQTAQVTGVGVPALRIDAASQKN
jgi:hypothetical protein